MTQSDQVGYAITISISSADVRNDIGKALINLFGISTAMAGKIINAAPIALFSGLSLHQAAVIVEKLELLSAAGCMIEMKHHEKKPARLLKWPTPPEINGLPVSALSSGAVDESQALMVCPSCGSHLKVDVLCVGKIEGASAAASAGVLATIELEDAPPPAAKPAPAPKTEAASKTEAAPKAEATPPPTPKPLLKKKVSQKGKKGTDLIGGVRELGEVDFNIDDMGAFDSGLIDMSGDD